MRHLWFFHLCVLNRMPLRNAVISVGECPGLNPYILGFGGVSWGGFVGGGVVWYGCVGGVGGLVCFLLSGFPASAVPLSGE